MADPINAQNSENLCIGVSEVADYKSTVRFRKFKITEKFADHIGSALDNGQWIRNQRFQKLLYGIFMKKTVFREIRSKI